MTTSMRKNGIMKNFLFSLVILFSALTSACFSQKLTYYTDIPEDAKENYITGITSDHPGLKSSCIYFAGRYMLKEAGELLVEELKKCREEDLSLLIAWSIYKIGEKNCLDELEKIAENHTSKRLKTFCAHLNQQKRFELEFERS
jgi:hypothetical protein